MTVLNGSSALLNPVRSFWSRGRFLKARQISGMEASEARAGAGVYRSAGAVLALLSSPEYAGLRQVQELLYVYREFKAKERTIPESRKKKPFIVMEGIDGCAIDGVVRSTPPACLMGLRREFDDCPQDLRRAYYALGNYIAASEVSLLSVDTPVVMDRFWHSTAAYAVASRAAEEGGELPGSEDGVYDWPEDLLRPHLVLFLDVSEPNRLRRIRNRPHSTAEEQRLQKHAQFRDRLSTAYRSMRNPSVTLVDGNAQINQVKESIILLIDQLTNQMETLGS